MISYIYTLLRPDRVQTAEIAHAFQVIRTLSESLIEQKQLLGAFAMRIADGKSVDPRADALDTLRAVNGLAGASLFDARERQRTKGGS